MHMIGPSIQNLDVMGFKQMAIYTNAMHFVDRGGGGLRPQDGPMQFTGYYTVRFTLP
jgi:hypothetical protein